MVEGHVCRVNVPSMYRTNNDSFLSRRSRFYRCVCNLVGLIHLEATVLVDNLASDEACKWTHEEVDDAEDKTHAGSP